MAKNTKKAKTKKGPEYKLVPDEFKFGNAIHTCIKRVGDVAIYRKRFLKKPWTAAEYNAGYEVVLIKRHNGYSMGGSYISPAETYPGKSQWGQYGWTYREGELDLANNRFQKLIDQFGSKPLPASGTYEPEE